MKKLVFITILLVSCTISAQVGIGNIDPQAALDISASSITTPTNADGILIPRVDEFPATDPTATQDGMMVFVTGDGTPAKGFYYWDNDAGPAAWVLVSGGGSNWTNVGPDIERQSGDVYIGNTNSTDTDLYISNNIIDWDDSSFFLDPNDISQVKEINFSEGSITDPSIHFGADTNTGFYRPATDAIGITTNGTPKFRFTEQSQIEFFNNGSSVFLGEFAARSDNLTNNQNIAVGFRALRDNVDGERNIAIGSSALLTNNGGSINVAIGDDAMGTSTSGSGNIAIGIQTLFRNTTGSNNVAVGGTAMRENTSGSNNTALGFRALYHNLETNSNVGIGIHAGFTNTSGVGNTYVGSGSGRYNEGNANVFLGSGAGSDDLTGSDRLYIDNSDTPNPLIYGEFDTNILRANSEFQIGDPTGTGYAFPTADGNVGQVLTTDGAGQVSFTVPSEDIDWYEEGTTTAPNAITDNIFTQGNVGIGITTPVSPMHIGTQTTFDLDHLNIGQDGIFIAGLGNNSGINAVGGSISFGPPHSTRGNQRKSAIASVQTSGDIDHTGLAFYVHGNPINQSPMVEGMRLTHNRRLGINNNDPSANLDLIGTMQFEDGNEAAGYVLASDATGNATWTDPTTIVNLVEKIDDLSDGKSDSDGSQDGSSIFLGVNAGAADDSDNNRNVGIGYLAMEDNTIGSQNTALGHFALLNNIDGSANTAVGAASLDANTTGIWNSAVGQAALSANIDGAYNTAVGRAALAANTDGNSNVALGVNAYASNTSGSFNTVIGVDAATALTANNNTIIGRRAMNSYSSGGSNVAIGASAGYYGSGTQNTYLGTTAGFSPGAPSRDGSVFLGYGAGSSELSSNKLYIENSVAGADAALIYGEFDNNILRFNGDVGIGRAPATNALEVEGTASKTTAGAFVANSDRRLKKNIQTLDGKKALEQIENLRGVTYLWNDNKTGSKRPEGIQYGFIAQEIQEVFPEKVSEDNLGYLQTAYGDYDALFVQAIKEQQLQIEKLSEENKLLKAALSMVDDLETRINALESEDEGAFENVVTFSEKK